MNLTTEKKLTVFEAAEVTGLKVSTIRKKLLRRELGYIKIGRSVRIPESEIKRLLSSGWRAPVSLGISTTSI